MMDRFPERYERPRLLSLQEGLRSGWTAACSLGNNAASGGCTVGLGSPMGKFGEDGQGDGFIDPEIIQGSV